MTSQGAALQTYNNELVKTLDELYSRKKELEREVAADEAELAQLQKQGRRDSSRNVEALKLVLIL